MANLKIPCSSTIRRHWIVSRRNGPNSKKTSNNRSWVCAPHFHFYLDSVNLLRTILSIHVFETAKENETLEAKAAELRQTLAILNEKKRSLNVEYNELNKKATEKRNTDVVQMVLAAKENSAKKEEVSLLVH